MLLLSDVKVCLVSDQVLVRAQKARRGLANVATILAELVRTLVQIVLPERIRQQVPGEGLDEDAVV